MSTSLSRNNEYQLFTFYPSYENVHGLLMEIHLYVFGQDGTLIQSQAIRREKVVVALSEDEVRNARIVIAPALDGALGGPVSLGTVMGQYAFEAGVPLDGAQSSYVLPPVPEAVWRWWLVHSLWKNVQAASPKKAGLLGW